MKRFKLWLFVAIICALVGFGIYRARTRPVTVVTETPVRRDLILGQTVSGSMVADKDVTLSAPATGIVHALWVKEGDTVYPGQVLGSITATEAWQNLVSSRLAQEKAIAAGDEIRETYGEDISHGVGYYRLKQAEKAAKQAEANIAIAQQQLANHSIVSPIGGMVVTTGAHQGELTTPTKGAVRVIDPASIRFEGEVDQEDVGSVVLGQKAKVQLDAYPNTTLEGEVSFIDRVTSVDKNGDSVVSISITVEKTDDVPFIVGLEGKATIVAQTITNVLTIPPTALHFDKKTPYVLVVEAGRARKYVIETGEESDDAIEVRSGLAEGAALIVDGPETLIDGAYVTE